MLDDCNNCLCPGGANLVNDELALEKALKDNELERKSLINDFENCGVSFPVTELEMYAHRKLLDEYTDPEEGYDGEGQDEDGDATLSADNLTNEDYATGIPEDLKDLLRKYYQLEAEREELLRMAGTSTAPNSVNGDEEHQPVSLRRVSTPRAPFWYFRRRSVAIVESEGDHVYETQERSGQSRHAWVPDKEGDDTSHTSHVTVVYPKERARKIRMGMFCCCLVMLGLAAVTVFYAMDFNETEKLEAPDIIEEVQGAFDSAFTTSPTASWEAEQEPCRDDIFITGNCFVRSETFGARFKNCNPLPDDWLALYPADEDPLALTDDFVNWMYSCGNKQCRGVVQSSFYSFQAFVPGTYRIHLIRNKDTQPYTAYASTAAFTVVENRLDCPSEVDPGLIPEIDP